MSKSDYPVICEDCLMAIQDEADGFDMDDDEFVFIALELGSDIPDHICEAADFDERCDCACNHSRRPLYLYAL